MPPRLIQLTAAALLLLGTGCHQYRQSAAIRARYQARAREPVYRLRIRHQECTDCADAEVVTGRVHLPPDLAARYDSLPFPGSLLLAGDIPLDYFNPTSFYWSPGREYEVRGKVIGVESGHGLGPLAVFYVEQYTAAESVSKAVFGR